MKKHFSFLLCCLLAAFWSHAQRGVVYQDNWWRPNGQVTAITRSGNTVYIGGNFTYVSPNPNVPYGIPLSSSTGAPNLNAVMPDRLIFACVPDGAGGWYIGGSFTRIGGQSRNGIARINANGTLHPWNPNANAAANALTGVNALAVSGNTVYVGGNFTTMGGLNRNRLAALDATTGSVVPWNPNSNSDVTSLAVSGNTVYAVGAFTIMGGQSRRFIAAIDATTGAPNAWNPNPNYRVYALAVSGNTVYVGGNFTSIGGQVRSRIAALNTTTGTPNNWNPIANDTVLSLAVSGSTVYAGGLFTSIGGQTRNYLAALDTTTGNVTSWNPNANAIVCALVVSGSTVYVGGGFTSIGGQVRSRIAALNVTTGNATPWNPSLSSNVWALAVSGSSVYAGGSFTMVGGQERNCIAALDAATGSPTPWAPNADSQVNSLAVSGNTVYAGGYFNSIGGQARNCIAALDATTGNATPWNPNASDNWASAGYGEPQVNALALSGSTVYVGGHFTNIGGQSRYNIAALDATSGNATPWFPAVYSQSPAALVYALALSGNTLYVGGDFTNIGNWGANTANQSRSNIAAIDATTANATSWNPSANGVVHTLVLNGSTVYAGGRFTSIGGQNRNYIAALNVTTGNATSWNPNASNYVTALAVNGSKVYAGGDFTSIGGQPRKRLAALDASTGNATSWNPDMGSSIVGYVGAYMSTTLTALAVNGNTVYAGGGFGSVAGNPNRHHFMPLVDTTSLLNITPFSPSGPLCGNSTVAVAFSTSGTFNAGNVFTAQLLDQTPYYTNIITIGTLSGTTSGIINAAIPSGLMATGLRIRVVSSNPATSSADNGSDIAVSDLPGSAQTLVSPATAPTICPGDSATLSVPSTTGFSYQWRVGGVAIPGATSNSYVATPTATSIYDCVVTNAGGCSSVSSSRMVTVKTPPVFTTTASGPTTFCAGSSVTLQATGSPSQTYKWLRNGAIIATGPARLITIGGNYQLQATLNGCTLLSPITTVTVYPQPAVTITTSGPNPFCSGSSMLLNASPNTVGNTYVWKYGSTTLATTTAQHSATMGGTYNVTVTNGNGCAKTSAGYFLGISVMPSATITALGSTTIGTGGSVTLQANAGATFAYQWYKGGVAISGATGQSYTATSGGSYTVRVTNGGCSKLSVPKVVSQSVPRESLGVTSGGVSDALLEEGFSFSAFPNPAEDRVIVRVNGAVSEKAMIQVMTVAGAAVKEVEMREAQTELDLSGMASGVYLIRYKDQEGRTGLIRLVKQ